MTIESKFAYHRHLAPLALSDAALVRAKDTSYGASWKRRGGVGAFMMLARKWDRLEAMLSDPQFATAQYDLFACIENGPGGEDGTALAEVRDLRRYLLLSEAEMVERGAVPAPETVIRYDEPEPDLYSDLAKRWGIDRKAAKVRSLSMLRGVVDAPVTDLFVSRSEFARNLRLAIEMDDHFDRLEFLKAWELGDDLEPWFSGNPPAADALRGPGHTGVTRAETGSTLYEEIGAVAAAPVPAEDSNRHAERRSVPRFLPLFMAWSDFTKLPPDVGPVSHLVWAKAGTDTLRRIEVLGVEAWAALPTELKRQYRELTNGTYTVHLLDRSLFSDEDRSQLERFPFEQNGLERKQMAHPWGLMYYWDASAEKWLMDQQWRPYWGRP